MYNTAILIHSSVCSQLVGKNRWAVLFKPHFDGCSILVLRVGLSQIYTSPMLVWLAQEDNTFY